MFNTMSKEKASENYYNHIMLSILNEKAYAFGLIDEKTRSAMRKEIQLHGQKPGIFGETLN